jgi:hypothetical protein
MQILLHFALQKHAGRVLLKAQMQPLKQVILLLSYSSDFNVGPGFGRLADTKSPA